MTTAVKEFAINTKTCTMYALTSPVVATPAETIPAGPFCYGCVSCMEISWWIFAKR
jgi:hypothetical protein